MVVAAFDFDNTLTRKDTMFLFLKFCFGRVRFFMGMLYLFPSLLLYKLKLLSNEKAKMRLFSYFFKGMAVKRLNQLCIDFIHPLNKVLNPEAINKMRWHQSESHVVVIVSASIENWVKPWAESVGVFNVIGTKVEEKNGIVTGKFTTPNCYGMEKVRRLSSQFGDRDKYILYAYGDGKGDRGLINFANYSFYRCFS
jgi:HAD superfamily hydrolase (TIGR01490 family)